MTHGSYEGITSISSPSTTQVDMTKTRTVVKVKKGHVSHKLLNQFTDVLILDQNLQQVPLPIKENPEKTPINLNKMWNNPLQKRKKEKTSLTNSDQLQDVNQVPVQLYQE